MNFENPDLTKQAKEFAPGIKRRDFPGDITKLKPGQLLDYVIQEHNALRAGKHYDLRIGNKPMGMYSWAMRYPLPKHPEDKRHAARTNLHGYWYNQFEGTIPSGYGAGTVKKHDEGKVVITNTSDNSISFSIAHKKHPERFVLVKPKGLHEKSWLLIKQETPDETGAEKLHYKSIPKEKIEQALENLKPGSSVQAKLDGALNMLKLDKGKAEMLSHRISKTTGKPVVQTERFFGSIPHLPDLPKEFQKSVALSEVYGEKGGKTISLQDLGGILNSSPAKALQTQKQEGVNLKAMLFDIAQAGGKKLDPETVPYAARKQLLEELIKHLPKGKFTLPEEAHTSEDAKKLLASIRAGEHGQTTEGIVIHPPHGTPSKHKIMPESDVFIRGFFPAEKGSKYEGNAVGGFTYSLTEHGPVVGRCGTGINDKMRRMMHEDPESFKGRIARIHSHGQFDGGAHRVPAFLALHEDYPMKKAGYTTSHDKTMPDGTRIDILKLIELMQNAHTETRNLIDIKGPGRDKRTGFSMKRYNDTDIKHPLLVGQDNFLIDGRHRYFKLKDQGQQQAQVKVVGPDALSKAKL